MKKMRTFVVGCASVSCTDATLRRDWRQSRHWHDRPGGRHACLSQAFVMTGSLPHLDVHEVNNTSKRRMAAQEALPDMQIRTRSSHNSAQLFASKNQLPIIHRTEHVPHGSLKALPSGLATVPLLPIVNRFSQQKSIEAHLGYTESQAAARSRPDGLPPEVAPEPSRNVMARPAPHYTSPQDRTPVWSDRNRPGRFSTPSNPYKQNLEIAPKLKQGANRFSSPVQYGGASELAPAMLRVESSLSRSPRQAAPQGLEAHHLAPLMPADLTHAGSLKQVSSIQHCQTCNHCHLQHGSTPLFATSSLADVTAALCLRRYLLKFQVRVSHSLYGHLQGQLLASVNNKLEALGLPRGASSLSRSQQWLAAHGISSSVPADAQFAKDQHQHQQGLDSAAAAWSKDADDSMAMAVTIRAKATAASPRPPDQARIPSDRWFVNSNSSPSAAAAAAGVQQGRQEPDAYIAHATLQALQASGPAFTEVQTFDSNTAECHPLCSQSQPLSPEPQVSGPSTLTPQPQALIAQPQALCTQPQELRAQPQMLSAQSPVPPPEQGCRAALTTDPTAVSHCNTEHQSSPSASLPAAAEATAEASGPNALQTPSGMHAAQTDTPQLAPASGAAQGTAALQLAPHYSTADHGLGALPVAAHISRIDSFADASSKSSSFESSTISQQGSGVVVEPGRTDLRISQPLEPAAATAASSPVHAAMQGPIAPGVMPLTSSTSDALRPAAGEEDSVEVGSEVGAEAGKEANVEAGAEVGVEGMVKADMVGSQGADMSAGFGSAACPENKVVEVASRVDHKQASSTAGPPTGIMKASDSTDGHNLEQHSPVASESCTGRLQGSFCTDLHKPLGYLLHGQHVDVGLCTFCGSVCLQHTMSLLEL